MASHFVARLWMKLVKKRHNVCIMFVGLDNSGKTSILNNLTTSLNVPPSTSTSTPTSSPSSSRDQLASPLSDTGGSSDTTRVAVTNNINCSRVSSNAVHLSSNQNNNNNNKDGLSPTVGYNYQRIHYRGLTFTALDFSGQNRYRNLWQEFYNCIDAIVFVIDSSDLIRLVVVRDELETLLSHPYFSTLPGDDRQISTDHKSSDFRQQFSQMAPVCAQKQLTLSQGKLVQSPLDRSSYPSSSILSWPSSDRAGGADSALRRIKIPILFLANKSDLANSVDVEVIVKALNLNQLPKSRHPWFILATSVSLNQGIGEGFDWLVGQLTATTTTTATTKPP